MCLLILLGGCDSGNPVAPSAAAPPAAPDPTPPDPTPPDPAPPDPPPTDPTPTDPPRPQDARFHDTFWGQMVFDRYEVPAAPNPVSLVLDAPMNLYIKTTDELGRLALFGNGLAQMIAEAPRYGRELSGRNLVGRVESGRANPGERRGWILVTLHTDLGNNVCGLAKVGANPGRIRLSTGYNGHCLDLEVFAHELGHAFGFWHVDPNVFTRAVMRPEGLFANRGQYRYSGREKYHAQLAYEVGREAADCGWPYGGTCLDRRALGFGRPEAGAPVVVN